MFRCLMIVSVLWLTACVATSELSPVDTNAAPSQHKAAIRLHELITQLDVVAASEAIHQDIYQLPQSEKNKFLTYFNRTNLQSVYPAQRLFDYMQHNMHYFTYHGNTYSAAETLARQSGNCLSLAILTVAYAELANIDYAFDLVTSQPMYDREQKVDIITNHVRTKLLAPATDKDLVFSSRRGLIIDYFPTRQSFIQNNVSHNYFISLYYQNLAADKITNQQYTEAIALAKRGYLIAPESISLVNLIAVSLSKLGQFETAGAIYQAAIDTAPGNLMLLTNYRILAKKQNHLSLVEKLDKTIDKSEDPSPFRWMDLAESHYQKGQFKKALGYFKRAEKIAPYLTKVHQGVAKTLVQLGDYQGAEHALQLALRNTHNDSLERKYQAKLFALSKLKL